MNDTMKKSLCMKKLHFTEYVYNDFITKRITTIKIPKKRNVKSK